MQTSHDVSAGEKPQAKHTAELDKQPQASQSPDNVMQGPDVRHGTVGVLGWSLAFLLVWIRNFSISFHSGRMYFIAYAQLTECLEI